MSRSLPFALATVVVLSGCVSRIPPDSYGVERLTHYRMLPQMGPPETTAWEYPMGDDSWEVELAEFYDDIRLDRQPAAGLADALAALRVVGSIYEESAHDHRA